MTEKKYNPFKVMGKTSKNALIKYLKADEDHNFVTVMDALNNIQHQQKQLAERINTVEQEIQKLAK